MDDEARTRKPLKQLLRCWVCDEESKYAFIHHHSVIGTCRQHVNVRFSEEQFKKYMKLRK